MKVFGIGMSRTGTRSLHRAMQILGLSSCHLPTSMAQIDSHDHCCDTTISVGYKLLDVMYPGSKFILTTREPESWATSVIKSWPGPVNKDRYPNVFNKLRNAMFGSIEFAEHDRKRMIEVFENHNRSAIDYFRNRTSDMTMMDIPGGIGWNCLCKFLNCKVPDCEFPWENKGAWR